MAVIKNSPLRILALHGYYQSDVVFSGKLGSLRKGFKKEIEFTFLRAPHKARRPGGEEIGEEYGWWFNNTNSEFSAKVISAQAVGFEESVLSVERIFEEKGPFDGILGFSQGAAFAAILCVMQQKKCTPVITYQKKTRPPGHILRLNYQSCLLGPKDETHDVPFHLMGSHSVFNHDHYTVRVRLSSFWTFDGPGNDLPPQRNCVLHAFRCERIPTRTKDLQTHRTFSKLEMTEEVTVLFTDAIKRIHDGGHYVPGKKEIYKDFIQKMLVMMATSS